MKKLKYAYYPFRDLFYQLWPFDTQFDDYSFAFLVHPRNERDVLRKYPFFKWLPVRWTLWFTRHFWPITVTKVTGLQSVKTGKPLKGLVISIPLTARQIIEHKKVAISDTRRAIRLGKRMGARIFGLGGLVSSATRGGLDLIDINGVAITTGHAYTGYNVTRNILHLAEQFKTVPAETEVAIVGAAGSIGSISAEILTRAGYGKVLLIDLERKKQLVHDLVPRLKALNPTVDVRISHHIGDIKTADYIVAATNAPEALIRADDLKPGAVVVDDAQPSDVADDVFERDDVLAIEAGVVHTPNIRSNFNMGLKGEQDNFCCMAELLLLAAHEREEHYVINRATLAHVDEVGKWGTDLGFTVAKYQNRKRLISEAELNRIATIRAG